jgi:hypothetical protein
MMRTVVFFIFNRPVPTTRVFERIRAARPERLIVVADGPRPSRNETHLCAETRAIVEAVDWPCEVHRDYSDANMGCGRRIASGLDLAFGISEDAIILEDDCLADPTFFPFAWEMLDRYRHDNRVFMVSGNNFLPSERPDQDSYYFSRIPHCWGWGTWRRAWKQFEFDAPSWTKDRDPVVFFGPPRIQNFLASQLDETINGKIDTWDYQWQYFMGLNRSLSIVPASNLVENVGFGADATHTTTESPTHMVPARPIVFPLKHPAVVAQDVGRDENEHRMLYTWLKDKKQTPLRKFFRKIRQSLREGRAG